MNERIRQLYYECQDESQSTEQCYQKFAELIIFECLGICEELGDKGMDGHYCADKILKHFEVYQ